jgi:hypothetical protein
MRGILTAILTTAAVISTPVYASPLLAISVFDDGVQIGSTVTSSTGAAFFTGSDVNFSDVQISAEGPPILTSPDLSTTTLQAEASNALSGTHILKVDIEQTGLTPFTGTLTATGTYNGLVGTPLGGTEDNYVNSVKVDSETLLPTVSTFGPVSLPVTGLFSDAHIYTLGFDDALESAGATMQTVITQAPEPSTWFILLGSLLAGTYLVRRRMGLQ